MGKPNHYFEIIGCKETGKYIIKEYNFGEAKVLHEIASNHRDGLKEARQWIGQYLLNKHKGNQTYFYHYCIKPGRKTNPRHLWSIDDYLLGVPK
jgi:hypothetical protein